MTTPVTRAGPQTKVASVVIASAASLSGAVDLGSSRLARIAMPATWTAANLTFSVSYDGTTFSNLYDAAGVEYTVQAAASREIIVPLTDFIGVQRMKVRSGTAAAAVVQGGDRTLNLVLVPL